MEFLIQHFLSVSGPQHNKTVVCYISTWAIYRPDQGSFNIDNFEPNLCTIAIYAFAGLDPANDAIKSLGKLLDYFNYAWKIVYGISSNCTKSIEVPMSKG